MMNRIQSDEEVELLKRALASRCKRLCIVPEGLEALLVATQIMELFSLGITEELRLATESLPAACSLTRH